MKDKKQALINTKINAKNIINMHLNENEILKQIDSFTRSFIFKLDKNSILIKNLLENISNFNSNESSILESILKTSIEIKEKVSNFVSFMINDNSILEVLKEHDNNHLNHNLRFQVLKFIDYEFNQNRIKLNKSKLKKQLINFVNNSNNKEINKNDINNPHYSSGIEEYEKQLIKLEKDIRVQLKTEFELKLSLENYQYKISDLEDEINLLNNNNISLLNQFEEKSKNYDVSE